MNIEFQKALVEALGLPGEHVRELRMTIKPDRLVEVTADILVWNGKELETLVREYRFEAVPK